MITDNLKSTFSIIGSRLENLVLDIDLKWVARAIIGTHLIKLEELTLNNSILDISDSRVASFGSLVELRKVSFTQKCNGSQQTISNIKKLVNSCFKLQKLILP